MTTGVETAAQATCAPQVGSFTIVEKVRVPDAPKGQVLLRVTGSDGTPFAGRAALATCQSAPTQEQSRADLQVRVDQLATLSHPALVPVLQTGLAETFAYWVYPADPGPALASLPLNTPIPISAVATIVRSVAAGLSAAHEVGLSHGSLSAESIVSPSPGLYSVAGLGLTQRGPAADQRDLGTLVIALLSGRAWQEETAAEPVSIEQRVARAQRLREWMSGSTERVVDVVLRATELDPSNRFVTIYEFSKQFADSVWQSGEDLVHGAFEAISARNFELARLLAAKAALYSPDSEGLTLLNLQLGGGSPFAAHLPSPAAAGESLSFASLALPPQQARPSLLPPELAQGLPPEFLEMVAPQFAVIKRKPGMHPMLVLAIGGVGLVLMLLVAAMATLLLSGR